MKQNPPGPEIKILSDFFIEIFELFFFNSFSTTESNILRASNRTIGSSKARADIIFTTQIATPFIDF